jgi:hypothetical protein
MTEPVPQYDLETLRQLTPREVSTALEAGNLDELLAGSPPVAPFRLSERPVQYTLAEVQGMSVDDRQAALDGGHLEDVLSGREPDAPEAE